MTEKIPTSSPEKPAHHEIESVNTYEQHPSETHIDTIPHERDTSSAKEARASAFDIAARNTTEKHSSDTPQSPAQKRRGAPSKMQREKAFKSTIKEVQSHMSPAEKATSRIIHAKSIEKTSDALGSTILRPNAMLAGSVSAFIFVTAFYFIAKNYGYQLSGFETIGAFIIGWVFGILYDYLRVLIRGHR